VGREFEAQGGSLSAKAPLSVSKTIESRAIESLKPFERNSRMHSPVQIAQLARSIERFGWTVPILISADGEIIAGHGRLLAAQELGLEFAPCIVADWMDADTRRQYVIADNQLALNADWDMLKLGEEVEWMKLNAFDTTLVGFSDADLARLWAPNADPLDPQGHFARGMPEFNQPDRMAFRSIIVHFRTEKDVQAFAKLVKQQLTPLTKYIWHPIDKKNVLKDQRVESLEGAADAKP
jgi:hypothetical protein